MARGFREADFAQNGASIKERGKVMQRGGLFLVVAVLLTLGVVACAPAAPKPAYPEKPVTLIVPFPAGGGVDLTGRALSEAIKPYFAQPLTVVNKPGGGGTVGAAEVVQSKPDGYTIGITGGSLLIQPHMVADLPYKGPADYQPVFKVVGVPAVFAIRTDAPWKTMKEVLDYAKANPGKLRVGTAGRGTALGIPLEDLKDKAKVDLTHVPFEGSAPAVTALLGGHVEAVAVTAAEALAQVKAGKIKVVATLEDKRAPLYPEAPSARELGYEVTPALNIYLVFAPKGTPGPVVQAIHDALKKAVETEALKKFAQDYGYTLEYVSVADFEKELGRKHAFLGDILTKMGLKK